MTPSSAAPDLTHAWLIRADVRPDRIVLAVSGARQAGLRFRGTVTFEQVTAVTGEYLRPATGPPELTGGQLVCAHHSRPGVSVLELQEAISENDVTQTRFTITHEAVTADLRLSVDQTIRAWAGFYPGRRDFPRE